MACAAPQAPSASPCPDRPRPVSVIAAVSVPTENSPPPSPIPKAPQKNSAPDPIGAAKTTAEKAATPIRTPRAAILNGSSPRPSHFAARPKPKSAPAAQSAESQVVAETERPRISPP